MFKLFRFIFKLLLLAILALIIILIFNPWNLRVKLINKALQYYFNTNQTSTEIISTEDNSTNTENNTSISDNQENINKNILLSEEQKKTLESWGVDTTLLPTEITSEMQNCLVEKIGKERIEVIISGNKPGVWELLKAKSCL